MREAAVASQAPPAPETLPERNSGRRKIAFARLIALFVKFMLQCEIECGAIRFAVKTALIRPTRLEPESEEFTRLAI